MIFFLLFLPFLSAFVSFFLTKRREVFEYMALVVSVINFVLCLLIIRGVVMSDQSLHFTEYFSVDALSAILLFIISVVVLAVSLYSIGYIREEKRKEIIGFRRAKQYYVLFQLFVFAMYLAAVSSNPVVMWVAIEATTLSTAFLMSFYNKPSALEAAWKYLIINSVGLLLGFFGTVLYVASVPSALQDGLVSWQGLMAAVPWMNSHIIQIAFILVLVGFGTKMGLVPLHTWLPDAHSKAPTPISSLLSGVLLNIAFFAVLRFKFVTDRVVDSAFSNHLFLFFGIVSVVFAAFILLSQYNYKRMLAYSSIEHMGIAVLGIGFGGIGILAALMHVVFHALIKAFMFLCAGNIFLKYSSTKIHKVSGLLHALPQTGVLFLLGFVAIVGLPPFGIFLTEFHILAAGIEAYPVITAVLVFALILAFVGFFQQVSRMVFGEAPVGISRGEPNAWTTAVPLLLFVIFLIVSFFMPQMLSSLFYGAAYYFDNFL